MDLTSLIQRAADGGQVNQQPVQQSGINQNVRVDLGVGRNNNFGYLSGEGRPTNEGLEYTQIEDSKIINE